MKNDFATIYKEGVNKVVPETWGESAADESVAEDTALAPAA